MKVRIVYISTRNHPLYPPGRMVSFRVENDADMVALHAVGIHAVCRWSSTHPAIAKEFCKVTQPIEVTVSELVSYYHYGTKTIDVATGNLCSTVDSLKSALRLTCIELNTNVDDFCNRMKVTPDQLIESINVRSQHGE